jgi:universal protein Kae1
MTTNKKIKYILGIESTAHTLGIAIVDSNKNILANEKDLYTTTQGGLIPRELAEHHISMYPKLIRKALKCANLKITDISLISFSHGPGIGASLKVGLDIAKSLKVIFKKPVIGVNHCISHLTIGKLRCDAKDPILLYVSGANTQIIAYDEGKYRIFGETLDMGVGNFIDSVGRKLGFGFPGGPKIEQEAKKSKKFIELPYIVKGMDITLGGLYTNIVNRFQKDPSKKSDLCYSLQETVFAMLIEVSERALAHTNKKELLLGGGVACNKRLQEMCRIMCEERGAKFYVPENQFLVDNAAMIAWQGFLEYESGKRQDVLDTYPKQRTDDVDVTWE